MAILTEEHINIIASCSPAILEQALNQLMIEDDQFDFETFKEFSRLVRENKGDLTEVLARTHQPVTIRQFVEDKDFLGNSITTDVFYQKQGIRLPLVEAAEEIIAGDYREALLGGGIGVGKSLALTTPIPTLNGWKLMGDLVEGDILFDEQGKQCRVLKAHPTRLNRPCYRVVFSDKTEVIADKDHLWYTETRADRICKFAKTHGFTRKGTVKTTAELRDTLKVGGGKFKNHSIPICGALELPDIDFRIDPYMLGVWLGDDSSKGGNIYTPDFDHFIIDEINRLGFLTRRRPTAQDAAGKDKCPSHYVYRTPKDEPFLTAIKAMDLWGNKHIPSEYLRGSKNQRFALIQGMMDTDGHLGKEQGTSAEWASAREVLADGFMELARSLGLKPVKSLKVVKGTPYYRVTFTAYVHTPVFRLPRKREQQPWPDAQHIRQTSRYIVDVVPIASVPVRCIQVDSPNSLFLAGEGMIPTHNTTLAQLVTLYDLYLLSTYRFPQLKLGMLPGSPVLIPCLNVTDRLAKNVTYGKLRAMVERAKYFTQQYPFIKRQKEAAIFPHNIRIMYAAANADKLLGEDVIGGIADELNFMKYVEKSTKSRTETGEFDQAREIYRSLVRRRASRFLEVNIGRFCMVSSASHAGDFTEMRIKEIQQKQSEEDTHKVYIWQKAQWEALPDSRFATEKRFMVEVGDERAMTRVLNEGEKPRPGAEIIHVPIRYKQSFETDPEGSLRDIAGRSAKSSNVFFKSRDDVWNTSKYWSALGMVSPWEQNQIPFDFGMPTVNPSYFVPFPECPRALHIDFSETRDRLGMACGFVLQTVPITTTVTGKDGQLKKVVEKMPFVCYDFTLSVIPPKSGQIIFDIIRQWIYFLRDELRIPIQLVTTDQFQSTDTRQIFRGKGFKTDKVSVEDLVCYDALRSAMHQKRIACKEDKLLYKELLELIPFFKKGKIDHPPGGGSKDIADAMCAVYTILLAQRKSWEDKEEVNEQGRKKIVRPRMARS